MAVTLYHNPQCSKSRAALALLEAQGVAPSVVRYLEHPLDVPALAELLTKLGTDARGILRDSEAEYKTLNLGNPDLDDNALLAAIAQYPKLMQRPILVCGKRAVIGRPPERILDIL